MDISKLTLIGLEGASGTSFQLFPQQNLGQRHTAVVGRNPKVCDIPITLPGCEELSRKHAFFTFDQRTQRVLVIDMDSRNETHINERTLLPGTPEELNIGDVIKFGKALAFRLDLAHAEELLSDKTERI